MFHGLVVFVKTLPSVVLPVGLPGVPVPPLLLLLAPKVYEEALLVPALVVGGLLGVLRLGSGGVGRFGRFHFAAQIKEIQLFIAVLKGLGQQMD